MNKKIIVLPAYNAAKTLRQTINSLPGGSFDDIILVDDASSDGTYGLALEMGITAFRHGKNSGYGANQKTCYRMALEKGADIIVMLHPDYQYDPRVIPFMTGVIEQGICDVVLGNRVRTRREAIDGGMPVYKYIANRLLTIIENLSAGQNLGEWHSGLRAYSRKVLETVNWNNNSDSFAFDSQFLMEAAFRGFRIGDIPVPARYFNDASSISFMSSARYGVQTLAAAGEFLLNKYGVARTRRYSDKPEH